MTIAIVTVVLAVCAALGVIGWHFSNEIIRPAPHGPMDDGLVVVAVDDSTVTLPLTAHTGAGRAWFLEWEGGGAALDTVVAVNDSVVRRRVRVTEGRLAPGRPVEMRSFPLHGDPRRSA